MSDPRPGHMYDPSDRKDNPQEYKKHKAKKDAIVRKMLSPAGKLSSMVKDKPVTLQDHLDWFRKHKR